MAGDFEARIRIYTRREGGRRTPAHNGIRWDFAYFEDPPSGQLYMIWPDFVGMEGPLPVGVELEAVMTIVSDEMRALHRGRIAPGVWFYCHEGGTRVAVGVVTRVTGLGDPA